MQTVTRILVPYVILVLLHVWHLAWRHALFPLQTSSIDCILQSCSSYIILGPYHVPLRRGLQASIQVECPRRVKLQCKTINRIYHAMPSQFDLADVLSYRHRTADLEIHWCAPLQKATNDKPLSLVKLVAEANTPALVLSFITWNKSSATYARVQTGISSGNVPVVMWWW